MLTIIKNKLIETYHGKNFFLDMLNLEEQWDIVKIVTFSSNLELLLEVQKKTSRLEFIYGLNKGDQKDTANALMNIAARVESIKQLNNEQLINHINDKTFDIRFSGAKLIHSKMFILESENRFIYITGSANFTKAALSGDNFEQVVLFDIDKTKELSWSDANFISEVKRCFDDVYVGAEPAFSDNAFNTNLKTSDVTEEYITGLIEEGNSIPKIAKQRKIYFDKDNVNYDVVDKLKEVDFVDLIFTKSGTQRATAKKNIKKEINLITNTSMKKFSDKYEIESWVWDKDNGNLVSNKHSEPFHANDIDKDDVIMALENLNEIVSLYGYDFKHVDETHQIATYLKYALTSPFIANIRNIYDAQIGYTFHDVPLFATVLGRGGTGKTTALESVTRNLLGINNYVQHNDISRSEKKQGDFFENFFNTNSVAPLLVDELKNNFFTHASHITRIKNWGNDLKQQQGVILTTANANNVKLKPEIKRRVLFIPIDGDRLTSSNKSDFNDIIKDINNIVFRLFVSKMKEEINKEENLKLIVNQKHDYLQLTTKILKDIYQKYDVDIHPSLLMPIYDITENRGKEIWQQLCLNNANSFTLVPNDENTLLFDCSVLRGDTNIDNIRNYAKEGMISGGGTSFKISRKILEEFTGFKWEDIESQTDEAKSARLLGEAINKSSNNDLMLKTLTDLSDSINKNNTKKRFFSFGKKK